MQGPCDLTGPSCAAWEGSDRVGQDGQRGFPVNVVSHLIFLLSPFSSSPLLLSHLLLPLSPLRPLFRCSFCSVLFCCFCCRCCCGLLLVAAGCCVVAALLLRCCWVAVVAVGWERGFSCDGCVVIQAIAEWLSGALSWS